MVRHIGDELQKNSVIPQILILFACIMVSMENLQTALNAVAGERISGLRQGADAISCVLDVSGMDEKARDALDTAVRAEAARLLPDAVLRIVQTSERRAMRFIAVASGKGGVGKSTLSANLAIAMRRQGRATGLVDADGQAAARAHVVHRQAQSDAPR